MYWLRCPENYLLILYNSVFRIKLSETYLIHFLVRNLWSTAIVADRGAHHILYTSASVFKITKHFLDTLIQFLFKDNEKKCNFRGDLSDISAIIKPLLGTVSIALIMIKTIDAHIHIRTREMCHMRPRSKLYMLSNE